MKLISPAKINLYLKVKGKRKDGFHEIESLMQAIDLHDTLHFEEAVVDSFTCPVLEEDNLVTRARDLFRKKTGAKTRVRITLEKRIPMEAGLGGGSSNAATTLWAMNELCGHPATNAELMHWSAEIGSDIPFFFSCGTAVCEGRGEQVKNVAGESKKYWIIKPEESLSTAKVFQELKVGASVGINDLEDPALRLAPRLQELKNLLFGQGFKTVQMSGSGTAFFCEAEGMEPKISFAQCYQTKTINRAPNDWYEL